MPEHLAEKLGVSLDVAQRIFDWHNAAAARNCANSKLTAAGLAYAADLALTAGLGTMQVYALKKTDSRSLCSRYREAAMNWRMRRKLAGLLRGLICLKRQTCCGRNLKNRDAKNLWWM